MKLEIFKTGTHTSSNGITKTFSEADLDTIISLYNPADHEAPVTIGHPKDNSPAHGWVKNLFRQDEILFAEVDNFSDKLKEGLKNKFFKKRSIALYPDLKLRHIGFVPVPSVKGLSDIPDSELFALSDNENNLENYESDFSEIPEEEINISESDAAAETENISSGKETLINAGAGEHQENSSTPGDEDPVTTKFFDRLKPLFEFAESFDLDKFRKDNSEKISNLQLSLDISYFESNLSDKVQYGSITPATKDKIISIIEFLNGFTFSDQENLNKALYEKFDLLIETLPKINLTGEFAEKPENEDELPQEVFEFAEVDDSSRQLHRTALSVMKKNNTTYLEAVKIVLSKN